MNLLILTQKVDKGDDNLGFFYEWIKKFAGKTERVFVIANFVGEHGLPANVQIFSLGKEKKLGRIRRYFNFYKYLFETLPHSDAIFVHMIPAWVILIWPIAFIFRKKIYLWYTHKSVTLSLRLAEKLAEKIFTASKESCRLNSKKIVITGHGIDVNRFAPKREALRNEENIIKLLAVGRISESKNYEFLINAAAILIKQGHSAILSIVGAPITPADLIYKRKLEDLVRQKDLGKNVNFFGPKTYSEMPDIYNSHDVLLHASETGSLDKVVLEAMACGLSVITTSEAFRGILAARYAVLDKNINVFAEKIAKMANNKDASLRNIVLQNHNLNNLIDKILTNL